MGMSSKNNSHSSNSRSVKSFAGTYIRSTVMQFAAHCTESQLNSIHLLDALHDFMDAEARTH